jgi:2-polyprenyl-3-methyl-5-hydroxy-6-metoxy-1,4-benzoquinol methylase
VSAGVFSRWLDHVVIWPLRPLFQNPGKILKDYLKSGQVVLDVGCGAGFFSLPAARLVGPEGRVVSADLSVEAIEQLARRAARAGLSDRIDARAVSRQSLEIDDLADQVDFALAFYVIHHAEDALGLMKQVFAGLRPGGRFLVVEPRHHASQTACEKLEATAREAGFSISDHPRLLRSWAVLLTKE